MRVSSLLSLALSAKSFVSSLELRATNWTVGQVVDTSSGPVTGHPASSNTDVSEYLGIPFAIPPVGDLRWTAPQSYNGTTAINGTNFGYSCPAGHQTTPSLATIQATNVTGSGLQILASLGQIGDNFSEDCLTLNIWTKPQTGEKKKAVLLWIYGGGFTTGNSDNPAYNGQFLAEQEDVVLVSFNYRLNVFGFPGMPNGTQNLGLLDQRLAVEWVQKNIAAFGGDPARITLFGQSAGSASVDYYSYAWTSDPIAHSFIEESGSAFGPAPGLGSIPAATAATYWSNLTTALDCTTLSCMKSISYTEILNAVGSTLANNPSPIASSFGPTVDEKVVFSNYTERSLAGKFSKLPLLLGNADYEAGLFKVLDAFSNKTMSDAYWNLFDAVAFTCPCATRANVSISQGVPTWRYRWFGAFPNTQLTTVPYSGAWHASELPVLFDTAPSGVNNTNAEVAIGKYLRGAWATFAKDPVQGLTNYEGGWPMYQPAEDTLVRLAYGNLTGTNLATGNKYDGACSQVVSGDLRNGTLSNSTTMNSTTMPVGLSSSNGGLPLTGMPFSVSVLLVMVVVNLAIL